MSVSSDDAERRNLVVGVVEDTALKMLFRAGSAPLPHSVAQAGIEVVERLVANVHRANDDLEISFLRMVRAGQQQENQNAQFGHVSETNPSKARRADGFFACQQR